MADLYYIEEDYFTPDGYFVYTADAVAAVSCESSLACELTLVAAEVSADLVSEFNVNAEALKIRSGAVELTATFSQTAIVSKTVNAVIDAATLFSTSVSVLVTSANSTDITSNATLSVSVTVTRASTVTLSTIVSLSLQAAKTTGYQAAISSTVTQNTAVSRTRTSTATSNSQFTQTTAVTRLRRVSAASNSQFTQTTTNRRVRFAAATASAAFTQSTTARKTVRAVSASQSTVTLSCQALGVTIVAVNLTASATLNCAVRVVKTGQVSVNSQFTLGIIDKFYDTGETLFISNVDSLLHFSELPLVDVFGAGTPTTVVGQYNGPPPGPPGLTLTTGKFGQTIDWPNSDYSLTVRNDVNFDLRLSDFTYEVWYKHGGDINNFGIADGRVMSVGGGASQITTGSVVNATGIYIYDASAHSLNNWGLFTGQVYLNWAPIRIPAPPANQITDYIVQFGVWTHFLISRQGETYYFFVNGVLTNTWTAARFNTTSPVSMSIGGGGLFGYTDEWRLRKNVSITSNFTPATQPYFPPRQVYAKVSYAIWETTANLTISGSTRVRRVQSNQTARVTVAATARRNIGPITAALTARATVTAAVRKTVRTSCSAQVTATTVTRNTRIRRQIVYLNSVATVLANVRKRVGTSAALNARVTTSQTARKTARGVINITAFNTATSANVKNARGTILMESRATLSCSAIKSGELVVESRSTATVTASFLKQPQPRQYSFALGMTAVMAVTARKIVKPVTYIDVTSTVLATGNHNTVNTFPLTSTFTLTANAVAGKIVIVNSNVSATVFANFGKTMFGIVNITAFATEVVIGTKVTIDPFLTLLVPPETAAKKVTQETALLTVDSENRVNIITHEQRNILVPTETSTWHLPTAKVVGVRRIK